MAFRRVSLAPTALRRLTATAASVPLSLKSGGGVTGRSLLRSLGPARRIAVAPLSAPLPALGEDSSGSEGEGAVGASAAPPALTPPSVLLALERLQLSDAPSAAAAPPPDVSTAGTIYAAPADDAPSVTAHPAAHLAQGAAAPSASGAAFACVLVAVLEFLPALDLLTTAPSVCTAWAVAAAHVFSWRVASGMERDALQPDCARESLARPLPPQLADAPARTERAGAAAPRTRSGAPPRARRGAHAAAAAALPRGAPLAPPLLTSWGPFLSAFPRGSFLAAGAYKRVYRVWCAALQRWEALSVMDAGALAATGGLGVVRAEIQVGCLLSQLARARVCGHFVETLQVFLHAASPEAHFPSHWGGSDAPLQPVRTRGKASSATAGPPRAFTPDACASAALPPPGHYLYIRSELCAGGDAEAHLRTLEPLVAAAEEEAAGTASEAAAAAAAVATAAAGADDAARPLVQPKGKGRAKALVGGTVAAAAATAFAAKTEAEAVATAAACAATAASRNLATIDAAAADFAVSLLWQLCFALFAARERVALRHFDVKLLNVFLQPHPPALRYAMEDDAFELRPRPTASLSPASASAVAALAGVARACYAKLADYGTAVTDPDTLHSPARAHHWTTLENAPPEFFVLGDAATQGYGADSWALGLCGAHCLLGAGPYEEALAPVRCPDALHDALVRVWTRPTAPRRKGAPPADASFAAVRFLVESDADTARVLTDALFRFAVLLGVPCEGAFPRSNPVWALLLAVCSGDGGGGAVGGIAAADLAEARAAYAKARALFSASEGSHPLLQRARRRVDASPAPEALRALLWGGASPSQAGALLSWHPDQRPTMRAALASPTFAHLRVAADDPPAAQGAVEFCFYRSSPMPDV